jgi:hypothetical protein
MVGDFFLDLVTPRYIDLSAKKLTEDQRTLIDSVLLFNKSIKLNSRNGVLYRIKPESKYYKRVKEMATVENNLSALETLAKFKNANDINIIKNAFKKEDDEYCAISAVLEFPDRAFYQNLVYVFNEQWAHDHYDSPKWRILYQALAKYPTDKTLELFDRTVTTNDRYRYQTLGVYLTIAINKYPNNLYNSIKEKIKLDKYHLDEVNDELKRD